MLPINVPNILTVLRILLTPVFVILLIRESYLPCLAVFTTAAVTDGLDGFLARTLNQRTTLGAYLDAIADKLLLTTAYVSLAVLQMVPAWLAVVVISRDVVIVLGVLIIAITGVGLEIKPIVASKLTTVAQLSSICVALLNRGVPGSAAAILPPLFWLTAALTTVSGLHYIYIGMGILQHGMEDDG